MKYIFRYTLLTRYTLKDQLISKDQLLEALKGVKSTLSGRDIDSTIQRHADCIGELIKNADKRDVQSIVKEMLEKDGLTDGDLSDIVAVWEGEKYLVYKKMLS